MGLPWSAMAAALGMRAAEAQGAELRLGNVTPLRRRGGDMAGVDLEGEALEAALCSGWKFTHSLSSISSSRITVTRRCVSFISPSGVTDPGVSASTSCSKSGRANETRGASNTFSSRPRSARLSASMTTSQMPPLRSFRKRFLPCRLGILSRQGLPCSTVKNGGCSTVLYSMPSRSSIAKRSAEVAGMVFGNDLLPAGFAGTAFANQPAGTPVLDCRRAA